MSTEGLLGSIVANQRTQKDTTRPRQNHPKGWEPGVILEGDKGSIVAPPTDSDQGVKWEEVFTRFHLDPEDFMILEPVHLRSWDQVVASGDVRPMYYYRADFVRRTSVKDVDYHHLATLIKGYRKPKRVIAPGDSAVIVNLADWQMGKRDGDGSEGITRRALSLIGALLDYVTGLRKQGFKIDTLVVAGLGDMVEGCDGHYAMQTFASQLSRRNQVKAVRHLLVKMLTMWAPHFLKVVVVCVPGNHGENRKDGKAFTDWGDNDDVAVFEMVAEILAMNPTAFGHVSFVVPNDDNLCVTLDVKGKILGFAHGHQATGGGQTPHQKIEAWWKGQMRGRTPIGDADILITGHYHHYFTTSDGGRTWFQCPSLDGGSEWFAHRTGTPTMPGSLVFRIDSKGFHNVEVLE